MGVPGDVSLVFHTKLLLQSPIIYYGMMETNFTDIKNTTISFTYEVQWH